MKTSNEALQGAFAALLKGDLAERDRLCDRAAALINVEAQASKIERILSVDFYVTNDGRAIPTKRMARAAGAIQ